LRKMYVVKMYHEEKRAVEQLRMRLQRSVEQTGLRTALELVYVAGGSLFEEVLRVGMCYGIRHLVEEKGNLVGRRRIVVDPEERI